MYRKVLYVFKDLLSQSSWQYIFLLFLIFVQAILNIFSVIAIAQLLLQRPVNLLLLYIQTQNIQLIQLVE